MTRRELIALAAASPLLRGQKTDESVGAAKDLLYQALELLSAHASPADVTRAIRFLRGALDQYASFGDARYFRALCLKRLNQDVALQTADMEAAARFRSEALRDQLDPFHVAVPNIRENLAAIGQKWALVVGISQFNAENGAEPLKYAANDATSFADLLKDPSVGRFPANQVFLLTNAAATTAGIKARLNTIATRAKPEDLVLVYLSTHGSPRSDDLRGVSYLSTYDTDVTSRDQIFGSALAMVDVSSIISSRCVSQRTVVILDTCHSGAGATRSLFATQAISTAEFDRLREGAGRYVISSCGDNQKSYEDNGHGLFTASLIDQLRMRKGCIATKELFTLVQKDVSARASKVKKEQTPVMAISMEAGQIVLGAPTDGANCSA